MQVRYFLIASVAIASIAGLPLAMAKPHVAAQSAFLQIVEPPRQDGYEEITIKYKVSGSGVTETKSVTVNGINGPSSGAGDPAQDTPGGKATKIKDAITAQTAGTGLTVTVNADSVTVASPGGELTGLNMTNNTKEKDKIVVTPTAAIGEISQAAFTFTGVAAGVGVDGQSSVIEVTVGNVARSFSVSTGVSMAQLRQTIRQELENAGLRATEAGTSVLVVLPGSNPSASLGLNDATLTSSLSVSAF